LLREGELLPVKLLAVTEEPVLVAAAVFPENE
jgi:hypothetical protein